MLTLYSPMAGTIEALDGPEPGVAIVSADAERFTINAPTRGAVVALDDHSFTLRDLQDREVTVVLDAASEALLPLVAQGDALGFDAPVFRCPQASPGLRCEVRVPVGSDIMLHAQPGATVRGGDDLLSIGPFACGA